MARTESLNAVPGVGLRCVPLPAQSVIEGKVGPQFPGVLGKQVKLHGADVHPVCRTLRIGVWETEEIVGYETAEPDVVGTASIEKESPTDVIKVQLIQALVADIDAELQRMLTQYPAIGVQGLINVSCLGEVSRSVVAKSKATRQRHKGNALVPGAVPGCDSKAGVCRIGKTLVGGDDHARILHQIGARRREQLALPVPVIDKPGLVNGLRRDRPNMRQIQLLKAVPGFVAKSRQVGPARQETREGLEVRPVRAVIIETELLLTGEVVVQAEGHLVLPDFCLGGRMERIASRNRQGHKLVQ